MWCVLITQLLVYLLHKNMYTLYTHCTQNLPSFLMVCSGVLNDAQPDILGVVVLDNKDVCFVWSVFHTSLLNPSDLDYIGLHALDSL
jgi:hypothetical protein